MIIVDVLVLKSGRCPFQDFLGLLDDVAIAKVEALVALLRSRGSLPFPLARKLQGVGQLWELRVMSRGRSFRIFYAYVGKGRVLLLSGFEKKSQKTPMRELERAIRLLKLFGGRV